MRLVNYKVRQANGTEFHTTNYTEAIESNNRISEIYLTEYSLNAPTEEDIKATEDHINKVNEYFSKKGV